MHLTENWVFLARVNDRERVEELEKQIAEKDAELERSRQRIKELVDALEGWKRGHRVRPGSKKAQAEPRKPKARRSPGRPHGHQGSSRSAPSQVDREVLIDPPACCPCCSGQVRPTADPVRRQLVQDLREHPATETVAYLRARGQCLQCDQFVLGALPPELGTNPKIGPRLQARMVEQKAEGLSLSQIQREARRAGISVSRGGIQQILHRSADVMAPLIHQVHAEIRVASHLWMDETSHRVGRANGWIWLARTESVVWFEHAESRCAEVAHQMIGSSFSGVIHSDFYAAYWTIAAAKHAPCWGHLIRTAREIAARTDLAEAKELHTRLQRVYRRGTRAQRKPETAAPNAAAIERTLGVLSGDKRLNVHEDIRRLQARIAKHKTELRYFVTDPVAHGTNNLSERTLRPHAMSRARCGPARSLKGAQTYAANLTAVHTLAAKAVPFLDAFRAARAHYFHKRHIPNFLQLSPSP